MIQRKPNDDQSPHIYKQMDPLSFIVLRHVRTPEHNVYWNECYDRIRTLYRTERIYIIDDNSACRPTRIGDTMINVSVIKSEFPPGRGELLPYYYYCTRRFSRNTVILHDTVFIHKRIDRSLLETSTYHSLWTARHNWDYVCPKRRILDILRKMSNRRKLVARFNHTSTWDVCYGAMSILNLDYITAIFSGTNYFAVLLREINSRRARMCFERICGLLLADKITRSVNGDIHSDQVWGTAYAAYSHPERRAQGKTMYKVWVGR